MTQLYVHPYKYTSFGFMDVTVVESKDPENGICKHEILDFAYIGACQSVLAILS